MRNTLVLLILILRTFILSGQERNSSKLPGISEEVMWTIKNAKGWILNEEKQWIEGANKIQKVSSSIATKETWNKDEYATGHDNFIFYEVRLIDIDGQKFLLMTKKYNDGKWKYKFTKQGWIPAVVVKYVVFRPNRSEQIKEKIGTRYTTSIFYAGSIPFSPNYLSKIALEINSVKSSEINSSEETNAKLDFEYLELDDKKNARFYINRIYGSDVYENSFEPLLTDNLDMMAFALEELYYECPKEALSGLIKLMQPVK